jgi:hypothetical protein
MSKRKVATPQELLAAIDDAVTEITVVGPISGLASLRLPPGVRLAGGSLVFGARGLVLSSDNTLEDVDITCPAHDIAITNDATRPEPGTFTLKGVRTTGQVFFVTEEPVGGGSILVEDLVIREADLRGRADRPHGFGVDALQGALTIWNRSPDPRVVLHVDLRAVSVGTAETPVRGSGVFVGGRADREGRPTGGTIEMSVLETGTVVIDGGISPGTPDLISGGVFVQPGAKVGSVLNHGAVTTLGANDMALDNWGEVERWTVTAPVTTRGPSGIGFVNFGALGELDVQAPIETYGAGARGFNLYDGTLDRATFDSVTTHADGAVGIQVTRPLPELTVRQSVSTSGGQGTSLVRGEQVQLKAVALSVKPGASIERLTVGGDIRTTGDAVVSLELLGTVGLIDIAGKVVAEGKHSDAAHVRTGATSALESVALRARRGRRLIEIED